MERRELIAERLAQGQAVNAGVLAEEFGVSPDAIRRDLRMLAADGRCRRVYGGALPTSPASSSMAVRAGEAPERKHALAEAAAELILPGEFLFLDNGSTNLALAQLLAARLLPDRSLPDRPLTVATNSAAIAAALADRHDLELHLTGGLVNAGVGGCVDATAILAIQRMNIDRCFLGACAVSSEEGVSAFDSADAAFKRVLLAHSRTVVIMATTEKLGTRAPHRVAALADIDCLVVEHDAAARVDVAAMAQLGIDIVPAGSPLLPEDHRFRPGSGGGA
jgi:DeoR/GlpR family transcriptional regulator of sugar metabolism